MFEEYASAKLLNNKEITGIIEYNNQELYTYKSFDKSGKLFHIAAFILANSKWLMNRVIDTLGGKPGNFYGFDRKTHKNQQCINDKWHHPFFSTDTDSMAVYQNDFERSKEYLADSLIDPNTNNLGGFHIDVEAPDDCDKSYQALIVKAVWICAKTYILKCKYVDKNGEVKTFYHRRAKGIPASWIQDFKCKDYIHLSQQKDKDKRSTLKYAKDKGYNFGSGWRFAVNKKSGEVVKDENFDRAFPYIDLIGKHRVFDEKKYKKMLKTGKPILLEPMYQ